MIILWPSGEGSYQSKELPPDFLKQWGIKLAEVETLELQLEEQREKRKAAIVKPLGVEPPVEQSESTKHCVEWDQDNVNRIAKGLLPWDVQAGARNAGFNVEEFPKTLQEFKSALGRNGLRLTCTERDFYDAVCETLIKTTALQAMMDEKWLRRENWPLKGFTQQLIRALQPHLVSSP
ncbi:MAG: hypothetical protein JWM16_3349 [Verrucomicrobiales bacterium]|nr:hypothetical protein [Verrucomicrobiales bacterium]